MAPIRLASAVIAITIDIILEMLYECIRKIVWSAIKGDMLQNCIRRLLEAFAIGLNWNDFVGRLTAQGIYMSSEGIMPELRPCRMHYAFQ